MSGPPTLPAEGGAVEASVAPPQAAAAVRLAGLCRSYGTVVAVDNVDVEIAEGEFFSLIGPSGCGKTTTLRMIAGLVEPSAGRIEVHGRDVSRLRPHKRPVNTVFQHYALFPHLDVFENVAFGLRERKEGKAEIATRVGEMLELVGLAGRERAKPAQLSGGQQQRVALARALVLQPEVLLLDEPLGALDLKLRKQLQLQLKRIQREVGITFVYVTHDQEEAFSMSDRVAIMCGGRIEQLGTPREVYQRPQTEFVADFVGASNRLTGTIVGPAEDDAYEVDLAGVGRVRASGVEGLGPGRSVLAIVRPESVDPFPRGERWVTVSARVLDLAYLGPQVHCMIETAGGDHLAMTVGSLDQSLSVGDRCEVGWPWSAIWVLPAD
jgi:spermidine/putrescine transport system ATP-binding protein